MANLTASLVLKVRLPNGSWAYCKPAVSVNGKLREGWAVVAGQPERHTEGIYQIRYLDGSRVRYKPVGSALDLAQMERRKFETLLQATADGVALKLNGSQPEAPSDSPDLVAAMRSYLEIVGKHKKHKTLLAYSLALRRFAESLLEPAELKKVTAADNFWAELNLGGMTVAQISRQNILDFMTYIRSLNNKARTVVNLTKNLQTFTDQKGLPWPLLATDKPRYVKKTVTAYSEEELETLLASASRDEWDLFQFLLCTGGREQDVQFAVWSDIRFNQHIFQITQKPDYKYEPKGGHEEQIPLPDSLIASLKQRKLTYPDSHFIFPTQQGKPDGHLLRILKRCALRAGLNCGGCVAKNGQRCATHPVCKRWDLHKFRRTFATMHHANGVPVRTIQRWLRHKDLETTLRYLAGADDTTPQSRNRINGTFAKLGRTQ